MHHMYYNNGEYNSFFSILFSGLHMILPFLIIFIIYYAFTKKNCNFSGYKEAPNETALELLKKRYVKGEITKDEYLRIKNEISN